MECAVRFAVAHHHHGVSRHVARCGSDVDALSGEDPAMQNQPKKQPEKSHELVVEHDYCVEGRSPLPSPASTGPKLGPLPSHLRLIWSDSSR